MRLVHTACLGYPENGIQPPDHLSNLNVYNMHDVVKTVKKNKITINRLYKASKIGWFIIVFIT